MTSTVTNPDLGSRGCKPCNFVRYAKLTIHTRPLCHMGVPNWMTHPDLCSVSECLVLLPRISESSDLACTPIIIPVLGRDRGSSSGLMHGNALHCAPSQSSTSVSTATQTANHSSGKDRGFDPPSTATRYVPWLMGGECTTRRVASKQLAQRRDVCRQTEARTGPSRG